MLTNRRKTYKTPLPCLDKCGFYATLCHSISLPDACEQAHAIRQADEMAAGFGPLCLGKEEKNKENPIGNHELRIRNYEFQADRVIFGFSLLLQERNTACRICCMPGHSHVVSLLTEMDVPRHTTNATQSSIVPAREDVFLCFS